jgi:hypothetical protein
MLKFTYILKVTFNDSMSNGCHFDPALDAGGPCRRFPKGLCTPPASAEALVKAGEMTMQ